MLNFFSCLLLTEYILNHPISVQKLLCRITKIHKVSPYVKSKFRKKQSLKTRRRLKLQIFDFISKSSSDRMKYNTLQLRYIQRREKAFDMCPEVR